MKSRLECLLRQQIKDQPRLLEDAKKNISQGVYNRMLNNFFLIEKDHSLITEMNAFVDHLQQAIPQTILELKEKDFLIFEERLPNFLQELLIRTEESSKNIQRFLNKAIESACQDCLDNEGHLCDWIVMLFELDPSEKNNISSIKKIIDSYFASFFQKIADEMIRTKEENLVHVKTTLIFMKILTEKYQKQDHFLLIEGAMVRNKLDFLMSVDMIVQQYVAMRYNMFKEFSLGKCPPSEVRVLERLLQYKGINYAKLLNNCYAFLGKQNESRMLMDILSPYKKAFSQHLLEDEKYVPDMTEAKSDNSSSNHVSPTSQNQSRASSSVSVVKNSLFSRSNSWSFLESQSSQEEWVVVGDKEDECGSQAQSPSQQSHSF